MDVKGLNRELLRMQHIDRLQVYHKQDSMFDGADTSRFKLLPNILDSAYDSSGKINVFVT